MKHEMAFSRIGMVARWRPVHRGHAPVLRALCVHASETLIGVGSANRYNARNPFTVAETMDMIRLVLGERDDYTLLPVPDLDDGPRWRDMVGEMFGPLDAFVTANPYVASLMSAMYRLVRPVDLITASEQIAIDGSSVRLAMARGAGWVEMVPPEIAAYIKMHKLDGRFRREFGLETLALDSIVRQS